jgi:hypothetical protein
MLVKRQVKGREWSNFQTEIHTVLRTRGIVLCSAVLVTPISLMWGCVRVDSFMDVVYRRSRRQWWRRSFDGTALALADGWITDEQLRSFTPVLSVRISIHEGCPRAIPLVIASSIHTPIPKTRIFSRHGCRVSGIVVRIALGFRVSILMRWLKRPFRNPPVFGRRRYTTPLGRNACWHQGARRNWRSDS